MREKVFEGYRLLVVDDDKLSRIALLRLLKKFGDPEIYSAENGNEAVSVLEMRGQFIDCVITDFNMPDMHGLQLLKLIRCSQNKIRRNMPVLMLTSHGDPILVKLAIDLESNGFVLKPVEPDLLIPRLQELLCIDREEYSWLKPVDYYLTVDVDSPISEILQDNAKSQISMEKLYHNEELKKSTEIQDKVEWFIDSLEEDHVLAEHIIGPNEMIYISAGTKIDATVKQRLLDLQLFEIIGDKVWVLA